MTYAFDPGQAEKEDKGKAIPPGPRRVRMKPPEQKKPVFIPAIGAMLLIGFSVFLLAVAVGLGWHLSEAISSVLR